NALVAADSVLIPMQAEYFALEGISELLDTMERIRASFNPQLEIEGVVLAMYDERTNLAQQVAAELQQFLGDKLMKTTIPRNIRLAEAPSHGKPALLYDVRSRGAESFRTRAGDVVTEQSAVSSQRSAINGSRGNDDAASNRGGGSGDQDRRWRAAGNLAGGDRAQSVPDAAAAEGRHAQ